MTCGEDGDLEIGDTVGGDGEWGKTVTDVETKTARNAGKWRRQRQGREHQVWRRDGDGGGARSPAGAGPIWMCCNGV